MTILERQAAEAGIQFEVVKDLGNFLQLIRVDGEEHIMSTHWRNYGMLENGRTIFKLLSEKANLRRKKTKGG